MSTINRVTLLGVAMAGLLALGLAGPAFALHGGGVAHCDACHSIHNSADNPVEGTENDLLLKGSDPSSTCLNCHGPDDAGNGTGYHIYSTNGSGVNQGGDFYWMTLTYNVDVRGTPTPFDKSDHGHNIIAADFPEFVEDTRPDNISAPGGTYLAANLGCTSCHNPHGQVAGGTAAGGDPVVGSGSYGAPDPGPGLTLGNYRLLGDSAYEAPGGYAFTADAPIARATNVTGSSYGAIVDYGQGMSEWCGNCHPDYVAATYKHPAGNGQQLGADESSNYNQYIATGRFTGNQLTSYDGLVPFVRGVSDSSTLSTDTEDGPGPTASDNVMCLTCHRAHASANANAGKWDFEVELLAESHALESTDVPVGAAVYYKNAAVVDIATEYGPYQRSLCNKCHVQD